MSSISTHAMHSNSHSDRRPSGPWGWFTTYIFAHDHKVIGLQYLFSTVICFIIGGILALSSDFYTQLATQHVTVLLIVVIPPILTGAFGSYLIPLMIGAEDMAFPRLNRCSYWIMWPALFFVGAGLVAAPYSDGSDWASYPLLSMLSESSTGVDVAQSLWWCGVMCVGMASMLGAMNHLTTIIQMRAPGMTMFRLPMTIWAMFITAIYQTLTWPLLTAAALMQVADRLFGTGVYWPALASSDSSEHVSGGGQPLLWVNQSWYDSHPAIYIMILPAIGIVCDIITTLSRKPLFGYRKTVFALSLSAALALVAFGHHMYASGTGPALEITIATFPLVIAIPSAVIVFNWIGTMWKGQLQLTTAMLFAIGFVSMFIIGGLLGILMATTPIAHFNAFLASAAMMGIFAGLYFWFPKMFGRQMSEFWGKVHFGLSFTLINCTYFPMYFLSGPSHFSTPYQFESFAEMQPLDRFVTLCALATLLTQSIFVLNFFGSIFFGNSVGRNPWRSNTLEWAAPSPPGRGNYDFQPIVHRGAYEYGDPDHPRDFHPQTEPGS